jgi:hypothetical protein
MLERIVLASSNPEELVADFFCGSGTTPFVAAQSRRRFIACDETFRAIHTTRSRLSVSEVPFSLERDANFPNSILQPPKTTKVRARNNTIVLDTNLDLDYWEVDPDWDRRIFKSAAQAGRPIRSGIISSELKTKAGSNVCVRLVTTQGEQYQLHI